MGCEEAEVRGEERSGLFHKKEKLSPETQRLGATAKMTNINRESSFSRRIGLNDEEGEGPGCV